MEVKPDPTIATREKSLSYKVDYLNKELGIRNPKSTMDKDDFLKILVTQLTHQDPTAPMQDREFIAQMAQFSSLEQVTNMSRNIEKLTAKLSSSEAIQLLGKEVEIAKEGQEALFGKVEQVTFGEHPQVRVKGVYYNYSDIKSIK